MSNQKYKTHLCYWISFGLLFSFLTSLSGSFLPYQSFFQNLLFKLDGLFAVCAFACLASKATSENYDLAGAGFTMLAISEGLFLASMDQEGHSGDEATITAVFFMIPSFILISYYQKFPKWLHIAGILSTIPFLVLVIIYYATHSAPAPVMRYIVYLLYQFITLCWAWQIWKDRKNISMKPQHKP
jgi:hypothetical protein